MTDRHEALRRLRGFVVGDEVVWGTSDRRGRVVRVSRWISVELDNGNHITIPADDLRHDD